MARRKKTFKPQWRYVFFGAVVFASLGLGLLATFMSGWRVGRSDTYASALATQAQIAQAKQDITAKYLAGSLTNCVDPSTNQPYDGKAYFEKYLHVNAYANRATIRPCNTGGILLAKIQGSWVSTEVNLNLDTRANPVWSRVCYVNDILTPDTVVRPENSSIDADNLKMCQALQHDKVLTVRDL